MRKTRRNFIGISSLGMLGVIPLQGNQIVRTKSLNASETALYSKYPTTHPDDISAVVGASHTNFEKVKELVDARPELAKATWDWGFGDIESALGAASHMGRKDIAEYLMSHGARADIFTFAMLGKLKAVKCIIEAVPGIESALGPHGFTLMHHANIRIRRKNVEGTEKSEQEALVEYLESIGGADIGSKSLEITEEEKQIYVGKYSFGTGDDQYFEVKLNSRKSLSFARGDSFGRTLNKVDEHTFAPGGGPSVRIVFDVADKSATAVTIHDPEVIVKASKMME